MALSVLPTTSNAASAAKQPNILVIVADDLGYGELSCQGNPQIPTPHIDSLATNGIRFTSGYVSGPYCSPTRAALLTGRYQQRFGHEFNPGPPKAAAQNFGLPVEEVTMPDRFRAAGYATGMFGKWHLGFRPEFHPLRRGFDEYFGFLGGAHTYLDAASDSANPILRGTNVVTSLPHTTEAFAAETVKFMEKQQNQPWFVYLPFNAVHGPLQSPEKYLQRFESIKDNKRRKFAAVLSAMDDAVGVVLAKLQEKKIEEQTLIFFFSDNGGPTRQITSGNGPLRGFKTQVWEGGVRVPFIIQWKGRIPGGRVSDYPVIQLDILPTALAAAELPVPADAHLEGLNLLPFLTGAKSTPSERPLFWRFGSQRAVRLGDWKLADMGQGAQLFDLRADIGEKRDVAMNHPEKVQNLERLYKAWNQGNIEPRWLPPRQAAVGTQ